MIRRHAGQASVEYLVGCLVVAALLLADTGTGQTPVGLVIDLIRQGYARFLAALSLA